MKKDTLLAKPFPRSINGSYKMDQWLLPGFISQEIWRGWSHFGPIRYVGVNKLWYLQPIT